MHRPYRGVEQLEARRAHNPEVVGSSPTSATTKTDTKRCLFFYYLFVFSNTVWGFAFFKSKYIVCLLVFQVLYFMLFFAGLYFNILLIRH